MSEETAVAEVETKTKAGKKEENLILTVAQEVENLSKTKALNLAGHLVEDIENNYFRLGGVLRVILSNAWFEGHESFEMFTYERFGFSKRKAEYLISIYTHLVDKQIPWEKVKGLGWTKLKDLAPILTQDNVDEWVAKATTATVVELQAMIKAKAPTGEGTVSGETTSTLTVMKFKLVNDQAETVQAALAKMKAEIGSDHDNVALESLCAGYLAGVIGGGGSKAPAELSAETMKSMGHMAVLEMFEKAFPEIDLSVQVPE